MTCDIFGGSKLVDGFNNIFVSQVMSKEQIVAVGKKKSTKFVLTPENSWAPSAFIVAYYVSDRGEVISDALSIPVQPVFKNQVSVLYFFPPHWVRKWTFTETKIF